MCVCVCVCVCVNNFLQVFLSFECKFLLFGTITIVDFSGDEVHSYIMTS